jgi:RNA polymerase sigma factor (sigma-70 family)
VVNDFRRLPTVQFAESEDGICQSKGVPSKEPEPGSDGIDHEFADALPRLLAHLPPRQRLVIDMRFFQGCKLSEVGEQLGVSHQRAQQIEQAALANMRIAATACP